MIDLLVILVVLALAVTFIAAPLRRPGRGGGRADGEGQRAAGGEGQRAGEREHAGGEGKCAGGEGERAAGEREQLGEELAELEAAREAKLREIRDAELDHRTGKLSDEDFAAVSSSLRAEAVAILRAIDTISAR